MTDAELNAIIREVLQAIADSNEFVLNCPQIERTLYHGKITTAVFKEAQQSTGNKQPDNEAIKKAARICASRNTADEIAEAIEAGDMDRAEEILKNARRILDAFRDERSGYPPEEGYFALLVIQSKRKREEAGTKRADTGASTQPTPKNINQ